MKTYLSMEARVGILAAAALIALVLLVLRLAGTI